MINTTAGQIISVSTNPISDFIDNTSNYTKIYLYGIGVIASFLLIDYSNSSKMWALVGRCASLFMAGEMLYTQLDQSWAKIAVTAIKTTSICLGIANIILSSPALLLNSLICDIVGQCGDLGLALYEGRASLNQITSALVALIVNLSLLTAINYSSAELLLNSVLIVFTGCFFNMLVSIFSMPSEDSNTDAYHIAGVNLLIGPVLHYFIAEALIHAYLNGEVNFKSPITPLNDSMVNTAASFFPFINFRSDIFAEWNLSTQ